MKLVVASAAIATPNASGAPAAIVTSIGTPTGQPPRQLAGETIDDGRIAGVGGQRDRQRGAVRRDLDERRDGRRAATRLENTTGSM